MHVQLIGQHRTLEERFNTITLQAANNNNTKNRTNEKKKNEYPKIYIEIFKLEMLCFFAMLDDLCAYVWRIRLSQSCNDFFWSRFLRFTNGMWSVNTQSTSVLYAIGLSMPMQSSKLIEWFLCESIGWHDHRHPQHHTNIRAAQKCVRACMLRCGKSAK